MVESLGTLFNINIYSAKCIKKIEKRQKMYVRTFFQHTTVLTAPTKKRRSYHSLAITWSQNTDRKRVEIALTVAFQIADEASFCTL